MTGTGDGIDPIRIYRDDGPLAHGLGILAAGQIPALLPAVAGALVTLILALTGMSDMPGIATAGPVLATLLAGLGGGAAHRGRLDWLIPPILRVTEYTFIAVVGLSSDTPPAVTYVLLAAMAFHHYDLVYRVRQRIAPPGWVSLAGLGWDGRMLVVALGAMFGYEPFAFAALAGYLWVLFAGESVRSWLGTPRRTQTVDLEEEGA